MAGWVLKLVLFWLVARAIVKLVRGIYEGLQGAASAPPPAVALVRDPVCGTFVSPATAPSVGTGSQTRFFCSENCRRIYQAKFPR
jgi:YHS domain-containing protein